MPRPACLGVILAEGHLPEGFTPPPALTNLNHEGDRPHSGRPVWEPDRCQGKSNNNKQQTTNNNKDGRTTRNNLECL